MGFSEGASFRERTDFCSLSSDTRRLPLIRTDCSAIRTDFPSRDMSLQPFSLQLWLAICGTLVLAAVILWATDKVNPFGFHLTQGHVSRGGWRCCGSLLPPPFLRTNHTMIIPPALISAA